MKKKIVDLIFRIRLTIFETWARGKLVFMRRDGVEFAKFGVTEAKLTDLENLISEFSEILTDDELLGVQVIATEKKDNLAKKLKSDMGAIMTRVGNHFGIHSAIYRHFGISEISALEGGEVSTAADKLYRVANIYITQLASEGLTPAILTDLKTKSEAYKTALDEQEDAIAARDIATENRCEKANEIYRLVVKYCGTGKRIWESVNEAKYNDYIIYDTPTGGDEGGGERPPAGN
jgi:hypothetical protein